MADINERGVTVVNSRAHKVFTWLFGPAEEINGAGRCPTYLYRWWVWKRESKPNGRRVYLHHFVGDDWCIDCHDHPKWFLSIGLWGEYVEITPHYAMHENVAQTYDRKVWRAPWVRWFPATHIHRLEATECWTLIVTGPVERDWGFWHKGLWIQFLEFVKGKSKSIADAMKSCAD